MTSNHESQGIKYHSALLAQHTFRKVNAMFIEFLRWIAKNQVDLPSQFDISSDGWYQAEDKIERAAAKGDYKATEEACDEYAGRAERFFAKWKEELGKTKAA